MKHLFQTVTLTLLIAGLIFYSCKKETLCEGCQTNQPTSNTNKPPMAVAGPDQTINLPTDSILLNGSGSYDPDGSITGWQWTKISGPSSLTIVNPTYSKTQVNNLTEGTYLFELKVTDAGGLIARDTMQVTVSPTQPPPPANCQPYRAEVPVSLTFLSNLPGQIQDPEIIAAGNKLFIPAWFSNATSTFSNNIYVYDLITQNWSTVHASQARGGVATIAAGDKVFFAGGIGVDDYNVSSVVDIYDLATNTWSVTHLSEARADCKGVVS
jgi:hypothetical protein